MRRVWRCLSFLVGLLPASRADAIQVMVTDIEFLPAWVGFRMGVTVSSDGAARTEGDSWDLASSVGATATMVAASRALASRGPDPLLDDRFAEPLVRAVGHPFFTRMLDGDIPLDDEDVPLTERQRCEQMGVRTRFFEAVFMSAISAG